MKKNNRVKKQSALAGFALFIAVLDAAEPRANQKEGLSLHCQEPRVGLPSTEIKLTKEYIVHQLTLGMNDCYDKVRVVRAVEKLHFDRYAPFMKTVYRLSQRMSEYDRADVIDAVGNVHPDLYTDAFVDTVHQLSHGMNANDKVHIIRGVRKVDPNLYTDGFISTVLQLSQGMDGRNKARIIEGVGKVHPDHYPFLQNFIRQNPGYFSYVFAMDFNDDIEKNMTQQDLQELLERLHREYYNDAPAGTPQGLAFEIHTFANQEVVGETGEKQSFNQAVLNHIESSIEGDALDYNIVLGLLSSELATLKNDPLKSDAINEEVYNWVIKSNEEPQDKNVIATVVTYLEKKDNTHGKLATWLYAFMDESKNAYDGRNSESCIKGVKERVITSLRSAIPEGDTTLENLFHQAETPFMMAAKSAKLTDYAFWAQQLKQKGITLNSSQDEAKDKFKEALVEFFGMDEHAQEIIDATLAIFDDSESDSDDASLRLRSGDSHWSNIKAALLKIEQSAAQPARAE
ncbi:MAG: hypothetical protein CNLJKLNK_00415 [Holosporales bacterium]